ncbi:hypothetical protein DFH06DRAFT_1468466 [Mycena polygramma]|nr:hypothetical protein DFH06DRAFT_1468466 [Mycena polygramma]
MNSSAMDAPTTRAAGRESAIIISPAPIRPSSQPDAPHRASVRHSRPINIPTRAPPPPPIITSRSHSYSRSPTTSIMRPPPRTPVSTDALGDDADYVCAPALVSRTPSPSSTVPCDVESEDEDEGDGEWEDLEVQYDEVPLSPLVASAPPAVDEDVFGEAPLSPQTTYTPALRSRWSASTRAPPTPFTPGPEFKSPATPYTPALRSRWSASTKAPATPFTPYTPYSPYSPFTPYSPDTSYTPSLRSRWSASTSGAPSTPAHVLRSRWSSSTLSSVRSAHALRSPASPKTFAFARRYFPRSPVKSSSASASTSAKSTSAKSPSAPKSKPKPMGSATILRPARPAQEQEETHRRRHKCAPRHRGPPAVRVYPCLRVHIAGCVRHARAADPDDARDPMEQRVGAVACVAAACAACEVECHCDQRQGRDRGGDGCERSWAECTECGAVCTLRIRHSAARGAGDCVECEWVAVFFVFPDFARLGAGSLVPRLGVGAQRVRRGEYGDCGERVEEEADSGGDVFAVVCAFDSISSLFFSLFMSLTYLSILIRL